MQGELFSAPQNLNGIRSQASRTDFLDRPLLHLSLGQLLISLISLLVFFVLVFSFGVEKGKRYAAYELRAERKKREKVMEQLKVRIVSDQDRLIASSVSASAPLSSPGLTGGSIVQPMDSRFGSTSSPSRVKSRDRGNDNNNVIDLTTQSISSPKSPEFPQGKYTIQIVTFKGEKMAHDLIQRLTNKGYRGFVIPSGKFLQVCVNGFDSREQANFTLKSLKEIGLAPQDAYIRNIPQ